ncbi:MAG: 50S ribosomal protein L29 [Desulfuromonadales bacterium]
MKPNDLRKIASEELLKKKNESTQEMFNLKFQLHTGRLENTSRLKSIRRDIARMNTIISESVSKGAAK